MRSLVRIVPIVVAAMCVASAWAQSAQRVPHIGYVYPAGGRRGSVVEVLVGGQFLRNVTGVHVSGEGVHAEVIEHYKPLRAASKEQRQEVIRRLRELIGRRWDEAVHDGLVEGKLPAMLAMKGARRPRMQDKQAAMEQVELPAHPLLRNLDKMDLRELLHVRAMLMSARKYRQQNNQMAESVLLRVTIAAAAKPAERELRLLTRLGLTNPLVFEVGAWPEVHELESNDPKAFDPLPEEPPLKMPALINGRIMPGDVDRFRFRAGQGQHLVIEGHARRLIPFVADAVPGWFQATLSLYDERGNKVAFVDDYRFDPDPVLFYEVPEDGVYEVEIHDALFRGREDFVYRLSISERPFVTWTFPLGTRAGHGRYADVGGWNMPVEQLYLTAHRGWEGIREKVWGRGRRATNPVPYAISKLPSCAETESNDAIAGAQRIKLPRVVDGRIEEPGDADVFEFEGRAGEDIVLEVLARRLQSPLDAVVWLTDALGQVLAWNDDYEQKDGHLFTDAGLLTHHADSYLRAKLPADGTYYVRLTDAQGHGGEAYVYRLRISPPQPDFAVWMTPSSVNVPAGRAAPLTLHAVRTDGFAGEIEVALQDALPGFALSGGRIPAGRDRIRMTLSAPGRRLAQPVVLQMEASAEIAGKTVSRPVRPADDTMQAFLYRHLMPAQELVVAVIGGRRFAAQVEVAGDAPVRIPLGGTAKVRVGIPRRLMPDSLQLELSDPPNGVMLKDVITEEDGLVLVLKSDGQDAQVGFADNLIVEVSGEITNRQRSGKGTKKKQRVYLGTLPAIPIEIVAEQVAGRSGRGDGAGD